MKFSKNKKKGTAMTSLIVVLGIVVFAVAITVPKFSNKGAKVKQKNLQIESNTILKDAKIYLKQSELPYFGISASQSLTEDIFNSLKVVNIIEFLNTKGALNGFKATNLVANNPNLNLGDLKVITNVPAKNIILDENGYLAKEPYIVQS